MPRYLVTGHVTVSAYTYVEADSPEQARLIAEGRDSEHSAHSPDVWEQFVVDDIDGDIVVSTVEPTDETDPNTDEDDDE